MVLNILESGFPIVVWHLPTDPPRVDNYRVGDRDLTQGRTGSDDSDPSAVELFGYNVTTCRAEHGVCNWIGSQPLLFLARLLRA